MRSGICIISIVLAGICSLCLATSLIAADFYIAETGSDEGNHDGSIARPWATITHALDTVPDGSVILVRPGTYEGRIRIRGAFDRGVVVRSEVPYRARLRHDGTVMTAYTHGGGVRGITIAGFDIAHSGPGAGALVIHIDGGGDNSVNTITLHNNILHDSYDNDILKINNSTSAIRVTGNLFYNQTGSDEHIDINSVEGVVVENNVFFNDFAGSGRENTNSTSSYIVIKDSNGDDDAFTGSRNVQVRGNVFLNWQGSSGSNFVLVGEDGNPFFEGHDILVENNLMLGNSEHVMRAPFGVKGGRDIVFRNNTVSGNLPALAYAMRLNSEVSNPPNQNIKLYNNIWSDPTGSMGASSPGGGNDFSDTPPAENNSFELDTNLYWNGGAVIPSDSNELVNYTDDSGRVMADPGLLNPEAVVAPRWEPSTARFADTSTSIRQVFKRLVLLYCRLPEASQAVDAANQSQAPGIDILGRQRPSGAADIGACEFSTGPNPGTAPGSAGLTLSPLYLLLQNE